MPGWLGLALRFIFQILLPFISSGYLLKRILAHSVFITGQRTSGEKAEVATYRFTLQNNEEVSLSSHQQLVIAIVDEGGQFREAPVVYVGCAKIRAGLSENRTAWTMIFDELPAYDTWTVVCKMNREARNVTVTLQEEGASFISGVFLSHDKLFLPSDRSSAFAGHRTTPQKLWAIIATAFALAAYTARALDFDFKFDLASLAELSGFDWWALGGIAIFSIILYFAIRRSSPPITQGYWRPTPWEPIDVASKTPNIGPSPEQSAAAGSQ